MRGRKEEGGQIYREKKKFMTFWGMERIARVYGAWIEVFGETGNVGQK